MIAFPNCKINLGLHIVSKRNDGYHDIETCFYPVGYKDSVEVIRSEEFGFTASGLPVPGNAADNLCIKAYELLRADFPQVPVCRIHLHKVIPMGAGLGGGSADGAFMLKLLNSKFQLDLPLSRLAEYALKLGSDCPFFIFNAPALAFGRGEVMEPVHLDLSGYRIVLVSPGIHVSTADAFAQLTPSKPLKSIADIIAQPVHTWKEALKNDFESNVFKRHPQLASIKEDLYNKGAVYASMSGSGSTVYGIFDLKTELASFEKQYKVFESRL